MPIKNYYVRYLLNYWNCNHKGHEKDAEKNY